MMTLSEKIELLIKRKQLSASQFADKLGIPRSSISHILSGRNKPSLDVVQKILSVFPEINAEDLLFEDRILAFTTTQKLENAGISIPSLFDPVAPSTLESAKIISPEPNVVQSNLRRSRETPKKELSQESIDTPTQNSLLLSSRMLKTIERVLIFYSDGTFSESKPSN